MIQVRTLTLGGAAHVLRKYPSYEEIVGPSWNVSGPGNPVCYTRGETRLAIEATLSIEASSSLTPETVLRAESHDPPLRFAGTLGTSPQTVRLTRESGALADEIRVLQLSLDWSYRDNDTGWVAVGTTRPIRVYQVWGHPGGPTTDLAVDRACRFAQGRKDPALGICRRIARLTDYFPADSTPGNPLDLLLQKAPAAGCERLASLLATLLHALGMDARRRRIWGGKVAADGKVSRVHYTHRQHSSARLSPSIRIAAPLTDLAEPDPHLVHHAIVEIQGRTLDPSYGKAGLPRVTEVAWGLGNGHGVRQRVGENPQRDQDSGWECGHP